MDEGHEETQGVQGIILRTELVPIGSLKPYKGNPRIGDVDLIRESLRINQQYRPLVVWDQTKEILAGNHTWKAAKLEEYDQIWATFVECDQEQAKRINLVDNRSAELGTYDIEALTNMLGSLPSLEGTGFGTQDLEKMLTPDGDGAEGLGEVPPDGYTSQYGVVVMCEDTEQQQQIYEALMRYSDTDETFAGTELKVVAV